MLTTSPTSIRPLLSTCSQLRHFLLSARRRDRSHLRDPPSTRLDWHDSSRREVRIRIASHCRLLRPGTSRRPARPGGTTFANRPEQSSCQTVFVTAELASVGRCYRRAKPRSPGTSPAGAKNLNGCVSVLVLQTGFHAAGWLGLSPRSPGRGIAAFSRVFRIFQPPGKVLRAPGNIVRASGNLVRVPGNVIGVPVNLVRASRRGVSTPVLFVPLTVQLLRVSAHRVPAPTQGIRPSIRRPRVVVRSRYGATRWPWHRSLCRSHPAAVAALASEFQERTGKPWTQWAD